MTEPPRLITPPANRRCVAYFASAQLGANFASTTRSTNSIFVLPSNGNCMHLRP